MLRDQSLEQQITAISGYDRRRCVETLSTLPRPRLDFTRDYLDRLDLDRLRHILAAALIQANRGRHST